MLLRSPPGEAQRSAHHAGADAPARRRRRRRRLRAHRRPQASRGLETPGAHPRSRDRRARLRHCAESLHARRQYPASHREHHGRGPHRAFVGPRRSPDSAGHRQGARPWPRLGRTSSHSRPQACARARIAPGCGHAYGQHRLCLVCVVGGRSAPPCRRNPETRTAHARSTGAHHRMAGCRCTDASIPAARSAWYRRSRSRPRFAVVSHGTRPRSSLRLS